MPEQEISIQEEIEVNFNNRQIFYRYQDVAFKDRLAKKYFLLLLDSFRGEAFELVKSWPKELNPNDFRLQFAELFVGKDVVLDYSNKKSWRTAKKLLKSYSMI